MLENTAQHGVQNEQIGLTSSSSFSESVYVKTKNVLCFCPHTKK